MAAPVTAFDDGVYQAACNRFEFLASMIAIDSDERWCSPLARRVPQRK